MALEQAQREKFENEGDYLTNLGAKLGAKDQVTLSWTENDALTISRTTKPLLVSSDCEHNSRAHNERNLSSHPPELESRWTHDDCHQ